MFRNSSMFRNGSAAKWTTPIPLLANSLFPQLFEMLCVQEDSMNKSVYISEADLPLLVPVGDFQLFEI